MARHIHFSANPRLDDILFGSVFLVDGAVVEQIEGPVGGPLNRLLGGSIKIIFQYMISDVAEGFLGCQHMSKARSHVQCESGVTVPVHLAICNILL